MAAKRPAVPASVRREVLVEAGHRCAIPTCRQVPVEVHHIDGNSANNVFKNLIALCNNDHSRVEKGEIDQKAVRMYKQNLALIAGRYSDMERRLLDYFVEHPTAHDVIIDRSMDFEFMYLMEDGLLENRGQQVLINLGGFTQGPVHYALTEAGVSFATRLRDGHELQ